MSPRRRIKTVLNKILRGYGHEVVDVRSLYPWQRADFSYRPRPSDEDALDPENPALLDLQRRYDDFDPTVTAPLLWRASHVTPVDLRTFRGENAYVWQTRGDNNNPISYVATYYFLKSADGRHFLDRLEEDGVFGAYTMTVDGRAVSRDLMDSVNEIYFLHKHLNILDSDRPKVLDIGAGYGRLAHRFTEAHAGRVDYLCTDGFATSTFLCDFYLKYRKTKADAVPIDQVADRISGTDLAINIHSFSECTTSAIGWWLDLLASHGVRHLFVVPNALDHGGERLLTNDGKDFEPIIAERGYALKAKEPKYADPALQAWGISPTHYYLFERAS